MSSFSPEPHVPIPSQPARDDSLRRLIVTASVVAFAIRDWSLWVLVRDGPWGPPMRLVLGTESVADAVERTLDALLMWPAGASLLQLRAGWQEQQVYVWGKSEQGAAVSLIHTVLLRANRDQLRPNLHLQPAPSLHVKWAPVADIESGQREIDPDVRPGLLDALYMLRAQVQHDPSIVLRYLADMATMAPAPVDEDDWWRHEKDVHGDRDTLPLEAVKEPPVGDGRLTLAEATLLYRAFFPPDEQVDLSNLRRRFLSINRLQTTSEERPVRGRELDWRRVGRVYRYV